MWHEARKQEKKVRGMIVDYKRRAERRREFYEKIRRDPAQFLQIHGSSAKIHMDSSISTAAESCLMPWRGDEKNMIDRFDVRAHLDTIVSEETPSTSTHNKSEIEKELASEKQINYERWRTLIQNDFLGIPESKALHQIWLEERFGMNQPSMTESPTQQNVNLKKKLAEKKAKIGYNYDKPEDNKNIIVKGESSESEEESDSDDEFDTTINIETLTADQACRLNSIGTKFGLGTDDFVRFAEEDNAEAERIKIAKELENEKSMFSGRKSRRERRALKERRMLILRANNAEENVKPIVTQGVSNAPNNKSDSSSVSSESEVDEAKIEFITCFGGSSDEGANDEEKVKKDSKHKSNKKKDKNSKNNANKKPTLIEFGPSLPPEIEQKLAKPSFKISPSKDITPPPRRSPSVRRSVSRSPDFTSRPKSNTRSISRSPSMARKFSRMRDRSRNRKRSRSRSKSHSRSRSRSRIFNTRMRSYRNRSRERRNYRKKSHSKSSSQSRSRSRSLSRSRSRSKSRSKSRRSYHSSRRRYRHGRASSRSLSRSCSRSFSRSPKRDNRKRGRSRNRSRNRGRNRDRSRSRSISRNRSRSRSRRQNRGRNRSRNLSRSRSRSRTRSRSRSRRRSRSRSRDRRNKDRLRKKSRSRSRSRSAINKRRRRKSKSRSGSRVRGHSPSQGNSKTKTDDKPKLTQIDPSTLVKSNSRKETLKKLNLSQPIVVQHNEPDNQSNLEIKLPDELSSSQSSVVPLDIPMPNQPNEKSESLEQIEPPKEKISSPSEMDISPLKESVDNQESISKDNSNVPGVTHDDNSGASTSLARQNLPLKRYYRHDLVDESSGPELDEEVDEEPPSTEKLSPRVANSVNTSTSKAGNSFKALTDKMKKKTQALIERQYKLDKAAEREKREKHGSDREKRDSRRYRPRRRSRSRSRSSSRSGKYSRSRSYSRSSSSSSRGFTKGFSRSRSRSRSSSSSYR